MKTKQLFILLIFTMLFSGCSWIEGLNHDGDIKSHSNEEQKYLCDNLIQGIYPSNVCERIDYKERFLKNNKILQEKYGRERAYLDKSGREPTLGLALAGGGTRAASFSIGVMKALKENGILDKVEVISSVSGGSYASYWYLSKLYYQAKDKGNKENTKYGYDIFRTRIDNVQPSIATTASQCSRIGNNLNPADCYRFQYSLENSSKILSWSKKPGLWSDFKNYAEVVGEVSAQTLSIPFHWLINGLFDWELDIKPYREFYQNGLERTYGYMPKDISLEEFNNAESFLLWKRVYATPISFKEFREFLEKGITKPPYFIINTTGRYGRLMGASHDDKRSSEKEVFEFTPWHCGSQMFGYFDYKTENNEECGADISWSKAVSISGAAVDGQYSNLNDNGVQVEKEFFDYLVGGALNLINGDLGYHINNYHTEQGNIWLHKFLPQPLAFVHDLLLSDSDLKEDHSTSIYLNDGGASENLGLFSLVQRGVKRIIVVDVEHDPESSFQAAKYVKNTLARYGLKFTLDQPNGGINVYDASLDEAVINGTIEGLVDANGVPNDIELVYIKLAVQAKHAQLNGHGVSYPYTVKHFMEKNEAFPHNSTADIFYDADQYKAYRDLGYTLGKEVVCKNGHLRSRSRSRSSISSSLPTVNNSCI